MASYTTITRIVLSAWLLFHGCHSDVKCRNDKGEEVDWYILYKLPKAYCEGLKYLYMDQSTNGWTESRKKINSNSGTLANTLKPLIDFYDRNTEGFAYLLYSDQPPGEKKISASYGHSKGVVMLDRNTGVWLSHSTPQFPTYRSRRFWPESGNANAQTFMCVTLRYNQFKKIGFQLKCIHAYSYDSEMPETFHEDLKSVARRDRHSRTAPLASVRTLKSITGRDFRSFAKYTRFGDDLYSGLIAPNLTRHLYVRSWRRNGGPLDSNCSIPHHVYDVTEVKIKGFPISNTEDHSKWCVTGDDGWTCIADMNREESQMKRGGGAICIKDEVVGSAFGSHIQYEDCKSQETVL